MVLRKIWANQHGHTILLIIKIILINAIDGIGANLDFISKNKQEQIHSIGGV
jgi:hypothetical protein